MLVRSSDENKWKAFESRMKLSLVTHAWIYLLIQHELSNIIVAKTNAIFLSTRPLKFLNLIVNLELSLLSRTNIYKIPYLHENAQNVYILLFICTQEYTWCFVLIILWSNSYQS